MAAKQMVAEIHAEVPETAVVPVTGNGIGGLIQLAIQKMDGDNGPAIAQTLNGLYDLYVKEQNRQAEIAFNRAVGAFQSECPPFTKGKLVDYVSKRTGQRTKYRYGELPEVMDHIQPYLSKNNLSVSWDTVTDGGKEYSVCKVSHIDGHSRTSRFQIIRDAKEDSAWSGSQEQGKAETYAMRRALSSNLGLTGMDPDTDAARSENVPAPAKISQDQAADIEALITEVGAVRGKFLGYFDVSDVADLTVSQFPKAVQMLEAKRKKVA